MGHGFFSKKSSKVPRHQTAEDLGRNTGSTPLLHHQKIRPRFDIQALE